jgi:hypothetical protein
VLTLYREQYFDFNVCHFHEKLKAEHSIDLSYTWVKKALQGAGLVKKTRTRRVHRKRRERRPLPGMLLYIDASTHRWCGLFADKAYLHRETQEDCKEQGWFLVASYKRHRHEVEKDVPTLYNRFVSAIRQLLESLFNWLIQKTDLQNASRVCY